MSEDTPKHDAGTTETAPATRDRMMEHFQSAICDLAGPEPGTAKLILVAMYQRALDDLAKIAAPAPPNPVDDNWEISAYRSKLPGACVRIVPLVSGKWAVFQYNYEFPSFSSVSLSDCMRHGHYIATENSAKESGQ